MCFCLSDVTRGVLAFAEYDQQAVSGEGSEAESGGRRAEKRFTQIKEEKERHAIKFVDDTCPDAHPSGERTSYKNDTKPGRNDPYGYRTCQKSARLGAHHGSR